MMMKIPFHRVHTTDEEYRALADALASGWLTMGPRTFGFEEAFKRFTGAGNAVAVSSCTAALHLSLVAAGVGPGDEVIIPAMTFVATAEAVRYTGARAVLCDVRRDDATIDPDAVERRITKRTRAVIPVHFGGTPCGMDRIMETAKNHGLAVIEDAAHALPAYYNGTCVGTIGDFTCFSFYATKPLSAGEGGMITTSDDGAAERCRRLRLHGISREAWNRYADGGSWRYDVTETGFKYNMTDIQAALGTVQLSRQNELRSRRARIAAMYDDAFGTNPGLIPHAHQPGSTSAHHLYVLRVNIEAGQTRDSLISHLASCGIGTSVHYIPLYRFTSFKDSGYTPEDFPNCEWLFERSLSLPVYPGLTDDEVRYVIDTVSAATGGGGGVS